MGADHVLEVLHEAGLRIALTPDQGLRVTPASALTTELRDLIRASKIMLVDLLERINTAGDTAAPWRVSVATGTPPDTLARLRAASLALDRMQASDFGNLDSNSKGQVSIEVSREVKVHCCKVSGEAAVVNDEVRTETRVFDRWSWLYSAAMKVCDRYGDSEAAREDMRQQCLELPPRLQADLLEHFTGRRLEEPHSDAPEPDVGTSPDFPF